VSARVMSQYKDTRFDTDPKVAASCRAAWITKNYGPFMSLDHTVIRGEGDQELYAYITPARKMLIHRQCGSRLRIEGERRSFLPE
jgi:hypothetical protein